MRLISGSLFMFALFAVVGCGGRGLTDGSSTSNSVVPGPATSASQPGSAGELNNDNTIVVSAGSNTSGIDVAVQPAAGSENAIALGTLAAGFAANTGAIVSTASTNTIVLFGTGLSGSMSVMLSGPKDIGISNIRSVQARDGTPGIAFDAVIGSSTAPGARSVYLKAPNNDITAFAGGLEVQP